MTVGSGQARPVYVLLDMSGSTVRGGFAAGRDQAIPLLIDEATRYPGLLVSVLRYATHADTLVWLSHPEDIKLIPATVPACPRSRPGCACSPLRLARTRPGSPRTASPVFPPSR